MTAESVPSGSVGPFRPHPVVQEHYPMLTQLNTAAAAVSSSLDNSSVSESSSLLEFKDPTSTAKSLVDTSAGLETADSRLNPENEVVDEEVELEDDVERTAGLSAVSQDLFSTLEVSSQSQQFVSGKHHAGEESPDVAFRGTPYTLTEHLREIKK
ncbi:hypothetical protein UY3_06900 [Chelonia mydas]|uniref:Uncharacterized protein n=1 Tax=Chelonia mydas TaxID=8469 RepID=M7BFF7_CHEMY|nr:hypothetical protein UY3_06900 [Chelonia mydas]